MIKKIIIVIFIISIFCLVGCLDNYIPLEKYNSEISELENQLEESSNIIDTNTLEIVGLKEEVNTLENDLELSKEETEKYQYLLGNLNDLLSNVYYGYAENSNWKSDGFTAFSIKYNGNYYLITAGHCVHYKDDKIDTGIYTYFKFKANFSNKWIYPELLIYNNIDEYAVLYSNKINSGLKISEDTIYDIYNLDLDSYVLGNEDTGVNVFKKSGVRTVGESGSPIISQNGEVVGIVVDSLLGTPIDIVIEAIDNLK